MRNIDTKVQMMDAGMKLFESENGFGTCLGQVKAFLKDYGKVMEAKELAGIILPDSTGEYDFFIDRSNFWRTKYISCKIEYAGEREAGGKTIYKYAASFREGNRSRLPRSMTMTGMMIAALTIALIMHTFIFWVACLSIILAVAYIWMMPSNEALLGVKRIIANLR